MSAPVKAPGSGAFAIEKAVVIGTGIVVVLLAAVHATGWVLAFVTGNPPPDFAIGRFLAAIRLSPYAAGIPPGTWLVAGLLLMGVAAAITGVWFQRHQTRRCLEFYGAVAARSIAAAPRVELLTVQPGTGRQATRTASWTMRPRRRLHDRPGPASGWRNGHALKSPPGPRRVK